jgi:hypothetical protein
MKILNDYSKVWQGADGAFIRLDALSSIDIDALADEWFDHETFAPNISCESQMKFSDFLISKGILKGVTYANS